MTFTVGEERSRTERYTTENVREFAEISGDENPIHVDPDYVESESDFENPVVHGVLALGTVSDLLTEFDGEIVLLNISSEFVEPVYHNTEYNVSCVVEETRDNQTRASISFVIEDTAGAEKLRGTADIIDFS